MKFIHLSDLHIGKHLYHYNMKEDQEHILEEVIGFMINLFRRQRRSQCLTIF